MPYTVSHLRLIIGGDQYGQTETWQTGLRATFASSPLQPTQAMADAIASAVASAWAGLVPCNRFRLTTVKLSWLGTDGLIAPDSEPVYGALSGGAIVGGESTGASTHWPGQCSPVVSLETSATRGRAHAGRCYLPPVCSAINSDGTMSATVRDRCVSFMAAIINSVNATTNVGSVSVMSPLDTGHTRTVTGVKGGLIVDTQRRRRRSLAETYGAVTTVTP